jgi:hypothetical protein
VKNILLTAVYEITDKLYGNMRTEDYERLNQLCVESFKANLKDIDEVIILRGKKNSYHEVFKEKFYLLKEIYHSSPCNILWADSDNLCVKPTELFGKFSEINMFSIVPNVMFAFNGYYKAKQIPTDFFEYLQPWFLSNIKYIPAGLPEEVWEAGTFIADRWVWEWAYECIVYNTMFHMQDIECDNISTYHIPKYNWQNFNEWRNGVPNEWENGIPIEEAHIIHFASSQGSLDAIEKMEKFNE